MFNSFSTFIASRYVKAGGSNSFIAFISILSMLGITLGVLVLVTVMAVMNGFSTEITRTILKGTPHITLNGVLTPKDAAALQQQIIQQPKIIAATPYIIGQGMLTVQEQFSGVMLRGIDPQSVTSVYPLKENIIAGSLAGLTPGNFQLAIGKSLARNLNLAIGDKVTVMLPTMHVSPIGIQPRMKRFTIAAIFSLNYAYDNSQVFINITDAGKLFATQGKVHGLHIKISEPINSPKVSQQLRELFNYEYYIGDWTQQNSDLLAAVKMEKTVMFFILLLIVAIAAFNLVSSLVMLVADKRKDIAILRAMGLTATGVMKIFIMQGVIIGIIGTIAGLLLGLLLAYNITDLVNWLQQTFDIILMPQDIYIINFLPSKVDYKDVIAIGCLSILMSIIATIYPAWRAANVNPAEALRYE